MFRIIRDYLYSLIGIIIALATLETFVTTFFPKFSTDTLFAVSFIIVLFVWFFAENIFIKIKLGRRSKYAETITNITNGFSEIHKITRNKKIEISHAVHASERLCNEIAIAFTVITGTKCNVSIKLLEKNENGNGRLKVIDFARNQDGSRNPKKNSVDHWIDANTDFASILDKIDHPKSSYFYCNTLPVRSGYQNTSFAVYSSSEQESNPFLSYWRWPLPYKSTIVVPICPCDEPSTDNLLGFLCVDSIKLGAFKKNYDIALLSGVADGIFNLMQEISELEGENIEINA